jgi:copper resistance protein C
MNHFRTKFTRILVAGAVGLLASVATLGHILPAEAAAMRHLTLDHALPGADSVVTTDVTEVRLFFSEPPQMRATTIRVVDAGRSLMTSTPPSAYEGDERQVYVSLENPLPPGSYVVQWRVMAQDGHVQRGDFTFRVDAE